jgi:hypothetical protein
MRESKQHTSWKSMASALIVTGDLMTAAIPQLLGESKEETSSESLQKRINTTFTTRW